MARPTIRPSGDEEGGFHERVSTRFAWLGNGRRPEILDKNK